MNTCWKVPTSKFNAFVDVLHAVVGPEYDWIREELRAYTERTVHVADILFGAGDVLACDWIVDILGAFQANTRMSLPTEYNAS